MLAKKYRLPHFIRFNSQSVINHSLYNVKVSASTLPYSRFGIIVSKKIDKRASVRNRIKRRFRACIENLSLINKPGKDVLFVIKKSCITQSTETISQSIIHTLIDTNIL